MDVGTLTNLIGSLGFPILACCALGWYIKYTQEQYKEQINSIEEKHKEEMALMVKAVDNNTEILKQLCIKLGV